MKPNIKKIAKHVEGILTELGADMQDPNFQKTPERVAKMYVNEIFAKLSGTLEYPSMSTFPANEKGFDQMLVEKNILVESTCAHHLLPFYGVCHIAYFPNDFVIGLSKFHRLVNYHARQPQVQELLTQSIANDLKRLLKTDSVAVYMECVHMCTRLRGVKDPNSSTVTVVVSGNFQESAVKQEFLSIINNK